MIGGERGIRTLGAREGTTVFETAPFNHSGTSPSPFYYLVSRRYAIYKHKPTRLT